MANGSFTATGVIGTTGPTAGVSAWVSSDSGYPGGGVVPAVQYAVGVATGNTFTATIVGECRHTNDPTVIMPISIDAAGTPLGLTVPAQGRIDVVGSGWEFRLRCTVFTAGPIVYRIGA